MHSMNKYLSIVYSKFLYQYREILTPVFVIITCIILLLFILIPQAKLWYSNQEKIALSRKTIEVLVKNLETMKIVDESELDRQLYILSRIFPVDKDYFGFSSAIADAAIRSQVSLGDYSLEVGDLTNNTPEKNSSLHLNLSLSNGIHDVNQFLKILKTEAPLSEVINIQTTDNLTTLTIIMPYKPFPQISFRKNDIIQSLSDKERLQIQSLSTYVKTQ